MKNRILPPPKNQMQEAFYLLLKFKKQTRRDFMNNGHIFNAPDCIMKLRRRGINIFCIDISVVNRFGRVISYGVYTLVNEVEAVDQYINMVNPGK